MLGKSRDDWIRQYSTSHQNSVNRACHTIGIPMIAVSILMIPLAIWRPHIGWWVAGVFVAGWVFQFIGPRMLILPIPFGAFQPPKPENRTMISDVSAGGITSCSIVPASFVIHERLSELSSDRRCSPSRVKLKLLHLSSPWTGAPCLHRRSRGPTWVEQDGAEPLPFLLRV